MKETEEVKTTDHDNGVSLLTANQSVNWHFPIMRWLEGEEESREKDVLVYQLQRYPFLAR